MCLGELAEVITVHAADTAEVRYGGRHVTVSLLTLEDPVAPGDWLIVHSGFALERLSAHEAQEAARIRAATEPERESP